MRPGTRVGEFELLGAVSIGRDSVLWRACRGDESVALKVVRVDAPDPLANARLGQEVAALTRTAGWSVPLLDSGIVGGVAWLATRWCDAGDLGASRSAGLDEAVLREIVRRLAGILAAGHERGVVHRDVKPANVLLTTSGDVFLGDYGNAAIDGVTYDAWATGGSRARLVAGTAGFAAPETESGSVDPAVDVFAFGCTVVSLCGGEPGGLFGDIVERCTRVDVASRPSMADVAGLLAYSPPARIRFGVHTPTPVEPPAMMQPPGAGRDSELTVLHAELQGAIEAEETRVVLLVGDPGCGKTWLAEQMLVALPPGMRVIRLRCTETVGDWRVLRPLVASMPERVLYDTLGRAPGDALVQAVGARVVNREPDLVTAAAALGALLRSIAPVVISIDDLHHATPELLAAISGLSGLAAGGLVVATARAGLVDADDLDALSVVVGELDSATLRAIAASVVTDPAMLDTAVGIAAGNPLHVLEAARALARGAVDVEGSNLRDLIGARHAAASGEMADALSVAAVSGDACWPLVVGGRFAEDAPRLVRDGWLTASLPSEHAESPELRFAHPLLREVVYERLAVATRRDLHGVLGERFQHLANPPVGTIADHLVAAVELGDTRHASDAVRFAASAGRQALDRWALSDAERRIQQLRSMGPGDERTIDLLSAEIALRRGEFTTAVDLVRPLEGADAAMIGCEALAALGDHAGAVELGDHAATGERSVSIEFVLAYSESLAGAHRRRDAVEFLRGIEAVQRSAGAVIAAARVRAARAYHESILIMEEGGDLMAPVAESLKALDELRALEDAHGIVALGFNLSHVVGTVDVAAAVGLLSDVCVAARRLGATAQLGNALSYVAALAIDLADRHLAESTIAEARSSPLDRGSEDRIRSVELTLQLALGDRSVEPKLIEVAIAVIGGTQAADAARGLGRSAPLWLGHLDASEQVRQVAEVSEANDIILDLAASALAGPPWELSDIDVGWGTAFHNEFALLTMLAGEGDRASHLLRQRHAFLVSTGSTYQRFNAYYPGALVAALGPPDTDPAIDWLVGWILEPTFSWMWAVHRCICGTLLAERGHPRARAMVDASLQLLDDVRPDPKVRAWLEPRLRKLI